MMKTDSSPPCETHDVDGEQDDDDDEKMAFQLIHDVDVQKATS